MLKRMLRKIPFIEAFRAFLEQWGLWNPIAGAATLILPVVIAAFGWVAGLPLWAISSLFIGLVVALIFGANQLYGLLLKRQQARFLSESAVIDRDSLADEIEDLSRKIASLVGWWNGAISSDDPAVLRGSQARLEGQLIEKFSYRHAADVWRLIRRASKIVRIDRG